MTVYDGNGDAKTIIHSGPLAGTGNGSSGIMYSDHTVNLSKGAPSSVIIAITSKFKPDFELNYSYLEDLNIRIQKG